MAAGVDSVVNHGSDKTTSTTRTVSITHTAGGPLLVEVDWRQTSDVNISSIVYDSVAMTLVVDSGFQNPIRGAVYRLDDPGSKTADLVITWASNIIATQIASMRATGVPAGGYIDSSGSAISASSASVDVTYSRVSSDTCSIHVTFRSTGATPRTCTADDGQAELFDSDGGGSGMGHAGYSLVETASGSLTRSATWTAAGTCGAVGVSLLSDTGINQPYGRTARPVLSSGRSVVRTAPRGDTHVAAAPGDTGLNQPYGPIAKPVRARARVVIPHPQGDAHVAAAPGDTGLLQSYDAPHRRPRPAARPVRVAPVVPHGESGPDATGTLVSHRQAIPPRRPRPRVITPPPRGDMHVAVAVVEDGSWRVYVRPRWLTRVSPRVRPYADVLVDAAVPGGDLPVYEGPGAYDRQAGNVDLTIPYPSTVAAGDVLILTVGHINSASQAGATYVFPADWELLFLDQVSSCRHWTYRKIATGTESGSITVTVTGGIAGGTHAGVIRRFSNADPATIEGAAASTGTAVTVTDAGVTTSGDNRLALQLGFFSPVRTLADFVGETGGDWTISDQGADDTAKLWLQTAGAPYATTVDGGTFTISATGAWIVRGFALIAATAEPPPVQPPTGGGGGYRSAGARITPAEARRLRATIERVWREKYGPRDPAPAVVDAVVEQVSLAAPPELFYRGIDAAALDEMAALLDILASEMERMRAERDAEETAILVVLGLL